ncbi:hypothetical protein NIES37_58640 [Tolypothrix tenuis PCC 7101]|uniref:Group 1 glycosyl transferase n=1 Tax=Tolypothrix tenuis PCC 7101 TaxID=231146 RepID=A0A1Z4N831_9CYAN|nr:glycosyltransferase family 4 protein [Aulosira sp. FACHB-113]BAZ01857.1 hypothetical protein NIES37_58640 [Tolypothrix tenuis PCC 7101]BAZ74218.1 hypothetical protein NIES50_27890 [Aulosira laxa NIES-50]
MNILSTVNNINSEPALFVSEQKYLKDTPGGVQICTREYINTLITVGFAISFLSYSTETKILTRIKRKLQPRPYVNRLPVDLAEKVVYAAKKNNIKWIFLNQVDTAPIAQTIRESLGDQCKIILLSHGLESTDIFHNIRTKYGDSNFSKFSSTDLRVLAQSLVAECIHRQYIDYVFCLSSFEAEIEHWLGAKNVTWLPRTIPINPLTWSPHSSRLGFVGTIDHSPNREGLILFLEALEKIVPTNVRLRLVGGPENASKFISQRFSFVEYLGQLSNEELEAEASTWSCFVHPLFCYSRGCSTKLAIALGWQIPVITTQPGCRGYSWNQGILPLAKTPDILAQLAINMLDSETANATRQEIFNIVKSCPTLKNIAEQVNSCLSIL